VKTAAGLLDLGAERGARRLALAFLDDAEAARARLEQGDDDEALHDFRVAIRRLRSTARAYADHLGGSIGGKDRRRLSNLADATNDARDLEVHADWLACRLDAFSGDERAAAEARLDDLRGELARAREAVRREVVKGFPRERWRLARRLRFYRVEVDIDAPAGGVRLAAVFGRKALELAADLERRLARVRSIDDQDQAHRARIAAKRLRYLIEPFAGDLEGAPELVKRLKRLQDALGEMHDADVLLARVAKQQGNGDQGDGDGAPADGDATLREMLERERGERFSTVGEEWLQGRAAGFFTAVREIAHAAMIRGQPDREIERKYLLKRMPAIKRLDFAVQEIEQGYLPGDRLAERLRLVRQDGETRFYRTVKLGKGLSRTEVEEETSERVFRKMWPLTRGKRVRKRRYKVKEGGFTWEVDRFRDRRLVLCEVELPSEDTDAPLPKWLRRELVRDVTGEDEYANINLAK
jgi:CHAD domain-containing protein/CYTH domain-containing protein